jgi:predicted permease
MRWLWRRSRREAEFDEEIRSHLAEGTRRRVAAGDSLQEAELAARREFGNITHIREVTREMWGWAAADRWRQDARDAVRSIRHSPGVAAAAILSMALGVGANTAIFRVMNALMFKPMPIAAAGNLYAIVVADAPKGSWGLWPYSWFEWFRDRTPGLTSVAATAVVHRPFVAADGAQEPAPIGIALVSGNYFSTLGLVPAMGRLLVPADDSITAHDAVVVISDAYWRARFGRAADVIGRRVSISGTSFAIVGVAPRGFAGDVIGDDIRLWVPISTQSAVMPERPGLLTSDRRTGWAWVRIVARFEPGVTPERASLDATQTWYALLRDFYPTAPATPRHVVVRPAGRGEWRDQQAVAEPVVILMAAVGLVLLIACANVANLLIARGLAREREFAMRAALGASATRLVRQLLVESLLLSGAATVLGVAVSSWGTTALTSLASTSDDGRALEAALDWRVLGFASALAMTTGLAFGLLPAWHAVRARVGLLTGAGHRHTGAGRPSRGLVVMQVAISIALLVGARQFAATLDGLRHVDLGVDRTHLLLVWTGGSTAPGSSRATTKERYRVAQERLSALPGVLSASPAVAGILNNSDRPNPSEDLSLDGVPARPGLSWASDIIGPGFFRTVGAPIVVGRDFTAADANSAAPVVILNQTLANFLFGPVNPVGRHLLPNCTTCVTVEIIGVARDMTFASPRQGPLGILYSPSAESRFRADTPMFVAVRTAGDPMTQAAAVRQAIHAFAPEIPVLRIETVDARLNTLLSSDRIIASLSNAFSALALLLAGVGLYSVVAYAVIRRHSEIGVRLALGATKVQIVGLIARGHAGLVMIGLALGCALAGLGSRLVADRLYGVLPHDVSAFASAVAILVIVAMMATLEPALRAARLDPARTLRSE